MDINTEYKRILLDASITGYITLTKDDDDDEFKFCHFLYVNGLLIKEGDLYKIGKLGYAFLKSGLEYDEWEKSQNKSVTGIHIGHNINAPVNQSDFSNNRENILYSPKTTSQIPAKKSKRSPIEIICWVVSIIAGLFAIYEALHKYHIVIKF